MKTILKHGATVVSPTEKERLRIYETARTLGLRYCDKAYALPNVWNCAPNSDQNIICGAVHEPDHITQHCTPDEFIGMMKAQALQFAVEKERPDTEEQLRTIIDRFHVRANIRPVHYMGARQGVTVHIQEQGRTFKLPAQRGASWGIFKP
jgi:hypothetical protein